jgi:hypothetical protein
MGGVLRNPSHAGRFTSNDGFRKTPPILRFYDSTVPHNGYDPQAQGSRKGVFHINSPPAGTTNHEKFVFTQTYMPHLTITGIE